MSTFSNKKTARTVIIGAGLGGAVVVGSYLYLRFKSAMQDLKRLDIFGAPEGSAPFARSEYEIGGAEEGGQAYV